MGKKKQKELLIIKKWQKILLIGGVIISIPLFLELIQNGLLNWLFNSKGSSYDSNIPYSFSIFGKLITLLFFGIIIGLGLYFWLIMKIFDTPKNNKK